jgi:rhodanese-related sulfurtransferase
MRSILFFIGLVIVFGTAAQNPAGFDKMCDKNIKKTVPLVTAEILKNEMDVNANILVLDAREKKEYNVSHIKGAHYIGYDHFKITSLADVDKNTKIYIYCSIGYRSEKIGEKLLKDGFKKVYNVYGGIFSWTNTGYKVVDSKGRATKSVHGYDKKWAKWINTNKSKVVVN